MQRRPVFVREIAVMIAVHVVKDAAWHQHAQDFLQGGFRIGEVPDHVARDDGGKRLVSKRQMGGVAFNEFDAGFRRVLAVIFLGSLKHFRRDVEPCDTAARAGGKQRKKSRAAAQVKNGAFGRGGKRCFESRHPEFAARSREFVYRAVAVAFGARRPVGGDSVVVVGHWKSSGLKS